MIPIFILTIPLSSLVDLPSPNYKKTLSFFPNTSLCSSLFSLTLGKEKKKQEHEVMDLGKNSNKKRTIEGRWVLATVWNPSRRIADRNWNKIMSWSLCRVVRGRRRDLRFPSRGRVT
jgi:hypothetical protein